MRSATDNSSDTISARRSATSINRAADLPLPTAHAIAPPPSTECTGSLANVGKLVKDAQLIAVRHPITRHLA